MKIYKIYIDREVAGHPETDFICSRLKTPVEYTDNPVDILRFLNTCRDPETAGKRFLLLTRNKGGFIRKCPGTTHYTCCNYHILHLASYCSMDCAYCILQAYFHPPLLTFFVNFMDMRSELDAIFSENGIYRLGTGEFTDSLIWEKVRPIARRLVKQFAGRNNAVLELKTKTALIEPLLGLDHGKNTIMSWSLNTERVIREQERGTAALDDRLRAAAACQANGYPLAFHFDPMIWYAGCEAEYKAVIKRLFSFVDPDGVVWISLGSFRFMPQLESIVERRFSRSRIIHGEFIRGSDGKMRYFKPLRIRLYQSAAAEIRKKAPGATLYFCMEDDEVWRKVLGYTPGEYGGLPGILDQSAIRHCGLHPGKTPQPINT